MSEHPETSPAPIKLCPICGEKYDEAKDLYHLTACREAMKP